MLAQGDISVEAFTCLLIFKNMFSFGLTWGAYNWIVKDGIVRTFNILGSVQVAVCLLSIPMCKVSRSSVFGHRPLTRPQISWERRIDLSFIAMIFSS